MHPLYCTQYMADVVEYTYSCVCVCVSACVCVRQSCSRSPSKSSPSPTFMNSCPVYKIDCTSYQSTLTTAVHAGQQTLHVLGVPSRIGPSQTVCHIMSVSPTTAFSSIFCDYLTLRYLLRHATARSTTACPCFVRNRPIQLALDTSLSANACLVYTCRPLPHC